MAYDTQLSAIGQIAMPVRDLARGVEFYRDRLGLPLHLSGAAGLAFFMCGDIRLMVEVPGREGVSAPGSTLYFKVDDIDEAYRDLQQRGVDVSRRAAPHREDADHELWMAFFDDGEGNTHALMQERRS